MTETENFFPWDKYVVIMTIIYEITDIQKLFILTNAPAMHAQNKILISIMIPKTYTLIGIRTLG